MSASPTDHQPRQPPAPSSALRVYLPVYLMLLTGHLYKCQSHHSKVEKLIFLLFSEAKQTLTGPR